jgi:hypothetical protein
MPEFDLKTIFDHFDKGDDHRVSFSEFESEINVIVFNIIYLKETTRFDSRQSKVLFFEEENQGKVGRLLSIV